MIDNSNERKANAIILAAGRGSRLKQLTDEIPKCLLKVGGKSLLEWQMSALRSAGITDITVVTGYKHEMIERQYPLVNTLYFPDWAKTNMVGTLVHARQFLETDCIVSYSDIIYQEDVVSLLHRSSGPLTISVDLGWQRLWEKRFVDPLEDAESLKMDDTGAIRQIGEKEKLIENIQGQYMGLFRCTPIVQDWLDLILRKYEGARENLDVTGMLRLFLDEQFPISTSCSFPKWCEIDTETDYALALEMFEAV